MVVEFVVFSRTEPNYKNLQALKNFWNKNEEYLNVVHTQTLLNWVFQKWKQFQSGTFRGPHCTAIGSGDSY